jgi:tetratricopeptide (TPR) repeat protein
MQHNVAGECAMRYLIILMLTFLSLFAGAESAEAGHNHRCIRGHHGYRTWGGTVGCGNFGYTSVGFGYSPAWNCNLGWNTCYRPSYYSFSSRGCYSRWYAPVYRTYYYTPSYYAPCAYPSYYSSPYWYSTGTTLSISPVARFAYSTPVDVEPSAWDVKGSDVKVQPRITTFRASKASDSRARDMIALGDAAFREGRYVDALTRYRDAVNYSPSYAEAKFRKGHAYLANGQYQMATQAFQAAFQLDPQGKRDGFQLKELYATPATLNLHLENLAAVALAKGENADAHYLLGVLLRYNGEETRAEKFFAEAHRLNSGLRSAPVRADIPGLRLAEHSPGDYDI